MAAAGGSAGAPIRNRGVQALPAPGMAPAHAGVQRAAPPTNVATMYVAWRSSEPGPRSYRMVSRCALGHEPGLGSETPSNANRSWRASHSS